MGYKSDLVTTLSGPGGGYVDGNDISRNTKAPTTTKVIKPQTEGEPPSAPQKWGQEWGAHKGMGEFFKIFFCNFLLLKTFLFPFSLLLTLQLSFLPLAFKFVLSSVLITGNVYSLLLGGNKPNPVADYA